MCTSVLECIVECLLGDLVQLVFGARRKVDAVIIAQARAQAGSLLDCSHAPFQRAVQTVPLQLGRTQLVDHQPHFFECLARDITDAHQLLLRLVCLTLGKQSSRPFAEERETVERLGYRVVQLARQPLALFRALPSGGHGGCSLPLAPRRRPPYPAVTPRLP